MSAYATLRKASLPTFPRSAVGDAAPARRERTELHSELAADHGRDLIDMLIDQVADRVAAAVAQRLDAGTADPRPEWLDSRAAAEYLGLHRDTLRKLAAERAIPAEQDGPGCKLFFRRSDLDEWRAAGGRAAHLSATLARAA